MDLAPELLEQWVEGHPDLEQAKRDVERARAVAEKSLWSKDPLDFLNKAFNARAELDAAEANLKALRARLVAAYRQRCGLGQ